MLGIIDFTNLGRYCMAMQAPKWMNLASLFAHILIAVSYFLIPLWLWMWIRRRPDLLYGRPWLWYLFVAFILGCGATHVMFFVRTAVAPWYMADLVVTMFTALVSLATALAMPLAFDSIISTPNPAKAQERIDALESELKVFRREMASSGKQAHEERMQMVDKMDQTRENIDRSMRHIENTLAEMRGE